MVEEVRGNGQNMDRRGEKDLEGSVVMSTLRVYPKPVNISYLEEGFGKHVHVQE